MMENYHVRFLGDLRYPISKQTNNQSDTRINKQI